MAELEVTINQKAETHILEMFMQSVAEAEGMKDTMADLVETEAERELETQEDLEHPKLHLLA